MKTSVKRVITVIIFIIVIFLGYRLFMLYRYTADKAEDYEGLVNGYKNYNTITITKKVLSEEETIIKNNIKIKNILDGYTLDDSNTTGVIVYNKEVDGNKYVIRFGNKEGSIQLVDVFVSDKMLLFGKENYGFLKGNILDADRKGFLKKNNIKNDIDLYKFIGDNYYIGSNIFTDTKTLKQNYAFNLFTSLAIPKISSWTILNGDIIGYIDYIGTENEISIYAITIIDNGKCYEIITSDPRFKDNSFITEFISTIEIVK